MPSSETAKQHTVNRLRTLSGRHNPLLKELRQCFARAELSADGHCAIEGMHILEEAIRSGLRFKAVLVSESAATRAERLLPQIKANVETMLVPDKLFASAVPTDSPQGIAALVRLRHFDMDDMFGHDRAEPLVLIAAGLQDPGNLGTLARSAEAFGASGLLVAEGTVSPYNAKAVRAAAGSLFRLPVIHGKLAEFTAEARRRGIRLLATSSHKGTPVQHARLTGPVAFLIGSEGGGLPRHALSEADEVIAIPHCERVESLNAGIAGSILLYEAARQRHSSEQEPKPHPRGQ